MEIVRRNDNLLGTNTGLERRVVEDDNKIGEEIQDEFKVVRKGKTNKRQESGVDEEIRNKKFNLTLVQMMRIIEEICLILVIRYSLYIITKMLVPMNRTANVLVGDE